VKDVDIQLHRMMKYTPALAVKRLLEKIGERNGWNKEYVDYIFLDCVRIFDELQSEMEDK